MTLQAQQAQLVDPSQEEGELSLTIEQGTDDQTQQQTPADTEEALSGDDVPEAYRGKSARELLDILSAKEEMIGRQANDLGQLREQNGTLRGVVDQAIAMQAGSQPNQVQDEDEALTADDLLRDPTAAINRGVRSAMKPLEDKLDSITKTDRQSVFLRNHPTALQDVDDPAFVDYVQKSPYRKALASKAFADMENINFEAAEELWLGYDEVRQAPAQAEAGNETETAVAEETPAKPNPSEVALVTSGGSGADTSADKTIYSAAALTQLQMNDPDKYYEPGFYNKIAQAFAEGRVQ